MLSVIGLLNCSNWGTHEHFFSQENYSEASSCFCCFKTSSTAHKKKMLNMGWGRDTISPVILPALKLLVRTRLALNSEIKCLCLWSAGIEVTLCAHLKKKRKSVKVFLA